MGKGEPDSTMARMIVTSGPGKVGGIRHLAACRASAAEAIGPQVEHGTGSSRNLPRGCRVPATRSAGCSPGRLAGPRAAGHPGNRPAQTGPRTGRRVLDVRTQLPFVRREFTSEKPGHEPPRPVTTGAEPPRGSLGHTGRVPRGHRGTARRQVRPRPADGDARRPLGLPGVNPFGAPPDGDAGERKVADYLDGRLQKLAWACRVTEFAPGRYDLVAEAGDHLNGVTVPDYVPRCVCRPRQPAG